MTDEREPGTVGPTAAEPETTEPTPRAPTFLDSAPTVDPDTTAKYGAAPKGQPQATTDRMGAEPLRAPATSAPRAETEMPTKVFEGPTAVFDKEPATVQVKKPSAPAIEPEPAEVKKPSSPSGKLAMPLRASTETPSEPVPVRPTPRTEALRTDKTPPAATAAEKPRVDRTPAPSVPPGRREAPSVYVVGFWKRLLAATIDLAIVIPAALLVTLIVSKIAGVHLPPSNLKVLDIDMWIDLVLATDPALVMGMVMFLAIGLTYLLVFQIVVGRTLGMRLLKMKIIDVYGDRPSPARCVARCGGYLASVATLFLGFLWMGFDSEKRGLQDWIAGTYVIRA
ncbi:MAG: RDD family protein [Myxococcales bacterium]|nr:RDD family protein [Myxococcales bacterium]